MWKTFGWFLAELPFRDVLVVRGATYLLAAINYSVGQGAIVYFVHRVRGVPVMRGVATVLLIMGTNLLVLLSFVTVGLALAGGTRPPALVPVVAVAWAGLAVYVAIVVARPKFLVSRPLFDVLLSAGLGGYLKAMLVRLPHIARADALPDRGAAQPGRCHPVRDRARDAAGRHVHRGPPDLGAGPRHDAGSHGPVLRTLRAGWAREIPRRSSSVPASRPRPSRSDSKSSSALPACERARRAGSAGRDGNRRRQPRPLPDSTRDQPDSLPGGRLRSSGRWWG